MEYVKKFIDNLEYVFYAKKLLFFNEYINNLIKYYLPNFVHLIQRNR